MQKMRPYVLPGLFVFHLIVLCTIVFTVSQRSNTEQPTSLESVQFAVTLFTPVSQFFLTALFAGLGTGSWSLRVPSWCALAAVNWFSFIRVGVMATGGLRGAEVWWPLWWVFVFVPLISWIVLVTLLLLLRVIPFLKWKIDLQSTSPSPLSSPPRKDSLTRGILIVVATWGGVLVLLKDIFPWSIFMTVYFGDGIRNAEVLRYALMLVGFPALVGAVALVVAVLAVSLTLTRLADWMFYRRRWTLPLLVTLVTGAAIGLLLSFGGPFDGGREHLQATLWLLLGLAAQPLATLLIMGMAGYRLVPRSRAETNVSELSSQTSPRTTVEPVGHWLPRLQRAHFAALVAVLVFFASFVPTGALNQHFLTVNARNIRRNSAGEITSLDLKSVATNETLRRVGKLRQLESLGLRSFGDSGNAGLAHLSELNNLEDLDLNGTQVTDAGLVHFQGMTNLKSLNIQGTQVTDEGVAELRKALPNCKISK